MCVCGEGGWRYVDRANPARTASSSAYQASDAVCWTKAETRKVASIDSVVQLPANNEAAIIAALALGPVAAAIDGGDPSFQKYKSGVFDG